MHKTLGQVAPLNQIKWHPQETCNYGLGTQRSLLAFIQPELKPT